MADLAVVLGASGGLGPSVVAELVGRGDRVIAVARMLDEMAGLEKAHPGRVTADAADLTRVEEVEALWKRIDATGETPRWVVNVTGGFRGGKLVETSPQDYAFMHDVNLTSAWWSCRAAAARLQKTGDGAIVNLASRSAVVTEAGAAAYALAKAGVVKLTQILAEELKASGVRVNAVLPAVIDTPENRANLPADRLRKAVAPEAVARVIAFLCSEVASPITGAVIPVYGRF